MLTTHIPNSDEPNPLAPFPLLALSFAFQGAI